MSIIVNYTRNIDNSFYELNNFDKNYEAYLKTLNKLQSEIESEKNMNNDIAIDTESNTEPLVVITMTSYPKRIQYVAKSIYDFLTTQIEKPDIFYLWLAVDEFPNKEKDLPDELIKICNFFNVKICWTETNEYCHKRWYVYPKHYNDIVISLDDDTVYDAHTIEFAKSKKDTKAIYNLFQDKTCYALYQGLKFIRYENTTDSEPSMYKILVGQCIFTPGSFPLDAIEPKNIELRKKYCPVCDESWLLPFIKHNKTMIGSMPVKQNEIHFISELNKTYNKLQKIVYDDLSIQDIQRYIVLRLFPELYKSWVELFPSYIDCIFYNHRVNILSNYKIDDLHQLCVKNYI